MENVTEALLQSYALVLAMKDETHSARTTRAWARARRALERAGAPDFANLGFEKPTEH
jgi:hypothetical protein